MDLQPHENSYHKDSYPDRPTGRPCPVPGCMTSELFNGVEIKARFRTLIDLKKHALNHHPSLLDPQEQHRCHLAGCKSHKKKWSSLDDLWMHMRVHHIDEKNPYQDLERHSLRAYDVWTGLRPNTSLSQNDKTGHETPSTTKVNHHRESSLSSLGGSVTESSSTRTFDDFNFRAARGTKRVYRRLNDILSAEPDISPSSTLAALLHVGESAAKQSNTFLRNLERPDLALQEWVKARIIAQNYIPNHAGHMFLQGDPGPMLSRYESLLEWVAVEKTTFDEVQKIIRNNNLENPLIFIKEVPAQYPLEDSNNERQEQLRSDDDCTKLQQDSNNKYREDESFTASEFTTTPEDPFEGMTASYPCHIRSCPNYRTGYASQNALTQHYEEIHGESYCLCDYASCQSQIGTATLPGGKFKFMHSDFRGSRDEYIKHLKFHHLEDIGDAQKDSKCDTKPPKKQEIEVKLRRCPSCLKKATVSYDGDTCKECKAASLFSRVADMAARFSFEPNDSSSISQPASVALEGAMVPAHQNVNMKSPDIILVDKQPSVARVENLPPVPPSIQLTHCSDPDTTITASQAVIDTSCNPEYTHIEYTSHKTVPFITIKQLGHGSLGIVDAVRPDESQASIVLARKVVRLPNLTRKRLLPLIKQEVAVLRSLNHQHIVKVVSTYETTKVPRLFGILLSPAGDEDLSHFLERVGESEFPEEDVSLLGGWQCCLASAIAYIHSENIRHKDIKPSNIICKGDQVYLTDFGSAHQFSIGLTSSTDGPLVGITRMYSAPEVIASDRRGRPADVYSLGCVIAEMATVANRRTIEEFHDYRSVPVVDEPDRTTVVYHATAHKVGPWFHDLGDVWVASLLGNLLSVDQIRRPSASDLADILSAHHRPAPCLCQQSISSNDSKVEKISTQDPKSVLPPGKYLEISFVSDPHGEVLYVPTNPT